MSSGHSRVLCILPVIVLAFVPEAATGQAPPPPPPQAVPPPPPIRIQPIESIAAASKPDSFPAGPAPVNDPHSWVLPADYPPQAMAEGHEGRTGFEVSVLPNGRVAQCVVIATSGWGELDQAACRLVQQRAQFRPAYDAAGKVVPGTYREVIAWRLPEGPRIDPFSARFEFVVGTDGAIHDCHVIAMTGAVPRGLLTNNPCTDRRRHALYHDASGQPVSKRVSLTYGAQVSAVQAASHAPSRRRHR